MRLGKWMVVASMGTLAACSVKEADNQTAQTAAATPTTDTASAGVVREEVTASPTPTPAPTPAAIQTQAGPRGYQVALNRAAVTGDILTIALSYSNGECCSYARVNDVSLIDDATSQRIGVLKDNSGKWMAGPMNYSGDQIQVGIGGKAPTQVFFKFPAPPATSKTVSLTIPDVAPFDAVPVTR